MLQPEIKNKLGDTLLHNQTENTDNESDIKML